ncbi:MAG: hypothetical protein R3F56_17540 [Planctomycetota bacterium]
MVRPDAPLAWPPEPGLADAPGDAAAWAAGFDSVGDEEPGLCEVEVMGPRQPSVLPATAARSKATLWEVW